MPWSHSSLPVYALIAFLRRHQLNQCRFERQQYLEVREGWAATDGELAGKNAVTTYGAEHFCRLLGKYNLSLLIKSS